MKTSLVAAAALTVLLSAPLEASAQRYGHGGGYRGGHYGGGHRGGHYGGAYRGGHYGGGYRGGHYGGAYRGGHYGGRYRGGYYGGGYRGGRYWGGHSHYYGGAWPYFGLGMIVGTGLAGPWGRPYPAYDAYPPAPYYAYPPPPPQACGSWVWDEPGYTWFWEPCVPGGPRVVVPHAQVAPEAPVPPHAPEIVPRG